MTEAGGFRSSRVTQAVRTETKIQNGLATGSSADGITITLTAGNFGAVGDATTPVAGQRFRVLSGALVRQSALVLAVVGNPVTSLVLAGDGLGAAFAAQSWEAVRDADDVLMVETALTWPETGEIAVAGSSSSAAPSTRPVRYRYDARVLDGAHPRGFSGLRARKHLGHEGRITCVAGNLIVEGTGITIDDGQDTVLSIVRFEFDRDDFIASSWKHSLSPVYKTPVTNAMSATQVRDALLATIQSACATALDAHGLALTATAVGTASIRLLHMVPGGDGPIHVVADTSLVAAGFAVDGARGVEAAHVPPTEVVEFSRTFSGIDQDRMAFFLRSAIGDDLTADGLYLSVPRPTGLADDAVYRRIVMAAAYAPRGLVYTLEAVLRSVLGPSGFEIFEDFAAPAPSPRGTMNGTCADNVTVVVGPGTYGRVRVGQRWTLTSGIPPTVTPFFSRPIASKPNDYTIVLNLPVSSPFTNQSWAITSDLKPQNLGRIFLRRAFTAAPRPDGRAILGGEDARRITDTTHVSLAAAAQAVAGVRLLDEPAPLSFPAVFARGKRLVVRGVSGGPKVAFNSTLITASAAAFGTEVRPGDVFALISGRNAGMTATLRSRDSSVQLTVGSLRGASHLRILHPFPMLPDWLILREKSDFRFTLPTDEKIIEDDAGGLVTVWDYTGADGNDVPITDSNPDGGLYIKILSAGVSKTFRHRLRVQPESIAELEFYLSAPTVSGAAGSGNQAAFRLKDGAKLIAVGLIGQGGTDVGVGFVDSAGAALGPWAGAQLTALTATRTWGAFTIRKTGRDPVELYEDGVLIQRLDYASFSNSAAAEIDFGAVDGTLLTESRWKHADWRVHTETDYWNARSAGGTTAASQDLIDGAATGLFSIADLAAGRRVLIRDFTRLNAAGGNARGRWQVDSFTSPDHVALRGETHDGAISAPRPASDANGVDVSIASGIATSADGLTVTALFGGSFGGARIGDILVLTTGPTAGRSSFLLSVAADRISAVVGSSVGPFTQSFKIVAAASRRRLRTRDFALIWPDHIGASIVIESGPNAGTYAIAKFLDPQSYRSIDDTYFRLADALAVAGAGAAARTPADIPFTERTNVVELAVDLPAPSSQVEAPWHLLPMFPADAGPTHFEVENKGSAAGAVLTLPQALPIGGGGYLPPVAVHTSVVASAHLEDTVDLNAITAFGPPPTYGRAPFYLYDAWGYLRPLVSKLVAGGVVPDFDRFFRNATGPHIIGLGQGTPDPLG